MCTKIELHISEAIFWPKISKLFELHTSEPFFNTSQYQGVCNLFVVYWPAGYKFVDEVCKAGITTNATIINTVLWFCLVIGGQIVQDCHHCLVLDKV